MCKSCEVLQKENPENIRKINCVGCTSLVIPATCINLETLICSDCPNIIIPKQCTKLQKLVCIGCPNIVTPDTCIHLKTLDCSNCSYVIIPETCVSLWKLFCSNCPNILIPDTCVNLVYLSCATCPNIIIPETCTKLQYLDCEDCPNIVVPDTCVNIEKIWCSSCPNFIVPDACVNLKVLSCAACPKVTIPVTCSSLRELVCNDNINFKIPNTCVNLEKISCDRCPNLVIPSTCINLEMIACNYNPGFLLSESFIKLRSLYCYRSKNIVIPSTCVELQLLHCSGTENILIPKTCLKIVDLKGIPFEKYLAHSKETVSVQIEGNNCVFLKQNFIAQNLEKVKNLFETINSGKCLAPKSKSVKSCWSESRFTKTDLEKVFGGDFFEKHICSVCYDVMNDPIECINGHCIGINCAEKLYTKECPLCRASLVPFSKSRFLNRIISGLPISCSNDGCKELVSVARIGVHEAQDCDYLPVLCESCNSYVFQGSRNSHKKLILCICGESVKACEQVFHNVHSHYTCGKCNLVVSSLHEMENHISNACFYRFLSCPYCFQFVEFCKMQEHQNLIKCIACSNLISNCVYDSHDVHYCRNGCNSRALLCSDSVKSHEEICPNEVVKCCFSETGCKFRSIRTDMADHESDLKLHLVLFSKLLVKTKAEVSNLKQQLNAVQKTKIGVKRKL